MNAPQFESEHRFRSAAAAGARAPWILVLGTGQSSLPPNLQEAAQQLGAELASTGFNLATFGWYGVDEAVASSFARSIGLKRRDLEERLVHFIQTGHEPRFPGGWPLEFSTEEDVVSGAIGYADAVVVIGGARWTYDFAMRAMEAGILVLPLADTSGGADFAARELFNYCLKSDFFQRRGLNPSTVSRLSQPISSAVSFAVNLLRGFFEENRNLKRKPDREGARIKESTSGVESQANGGPFVYVSYNVREAEMVIPIAERLRKRGIPLWVDKWFLHPGDNLELLIEQAKANCPVWIVFLGPQGPGPTHGKEIEEASTRIAISTPDSFAALPVLLPGAGTTLPPLFQKLIRIQFESQSDEYAFESLLRSLNERLRQIREKPTKPDPRVAELVADPERLATFCARLALYNRSAVRLVEAPDSAVLAESLRTSGVTTQKELGDRAQELNSNQETAGLAPNALWIAWFTTARREKLDQIGKYMLSLPAPDIPVSPTAVPKPVSSSESFPTKTAKPSRSNKTRKPKSSDDNPRSAPK